VAAAQAVGMAVSITRSDAIHWPGACWATNDALAKVAPPPLRDRLGRSLDAACGELSVPAGRACRTKGFPADARRRGYGRAFRERWNEREISR
jgi:hypothetical protein